LSGVVPSAFIFQTDVAPPRSLTNRMVCPLGDQSGSVSRLELVGVRSTGDDPSAGVTVQISKLPLWSESNGSLAPALLHGGSASVPLSFVIRVWFDPSGFMT